MSTVTTVTAPAVQPVVARRARVHARRRRLRHALAPPLRLSAHTPREIFVPLLTPILFADVIAPALAKSMTARAASTT